MSHYDRLYTRLAGTMLILGPALIVCAALLAAAGIGTSTGRWYDNWLEGILLALGFMLQLIGLLALSRRIGATRPVLGIVITLTSVLGTLGAAFPAVARVLSTAELASGITVDQLDVVHGATGEMTAANMLIVPFILCFFLNYFLLAFGLWRTQSGPRFSPLLLALGAILFPIAQTSFEVNMPVYVAAVTAWLLGLAPLGFGMLRVAGVSEMLVAEAGTSN